jgi:hypothetical protein
VCCHEYLSEFALAQLLADLEVGKGEGLGGRVVEGKGGWGRGLAGMGGDGGWRIGRE